MKLHIKNSPKRLKKKEAILDSALNVFAEHGYMNTRLEQITDALDLTDKSIYYYFSNKGDLFIEVILSLQSKLNSLIDRIDAKDCNHHEKIKLYTSHAMSIHGLTLLMKLPQSLSEFSKYDAIRSNEISQYKIWTQWFRKGQLEGSIIHGDAAEQRNFLFGSLFYLHEWHSIRDSESYSKIQPFIELMIDRMYSTNYNKTQ
ncbi:TetR/AcrR family transcriptional regulator [Gammaproteobacteria bacterium]|jgi:AcrR family transcriptional regulator|nr:TetR/AcrR family transcriptional regulator [Gammaproteobacteria bacterium]